MNNYTIVCGFPGVGKSYLADRADCVDLESSNFKFGGNHSHRDYDNTRQQTAVWPVNYVDAAIAASESGKIVCLSTHKEVRDELTARGLNFFVVYPASVRKEEFLLSYTKRGSDPRFVDFMRDNWDTLLAEFNNYGNRPINQTWIELGAYKFLANVPLTVFQNA